ncbi:hypothetical protein SARC_02382 [Sphaeroforma arctica JP610]|uniref:BTB domain-containing protein n=1 Tax=Sphaeroforma arctica JP610 TaxID=667725 RepID=A0A0L0G8S1_9EUKA|nr:hypothetical protein SARC_02382 [Sphaeroforma arctica JP610]KNC85432.1 hypothetical protein SARC_02382 [Sphaeroforma arctica JP610]|eukprot:XP_014159334.1 hypothetical protein SARC_02382 [Sphaeroforma arctica JP610]
MGAGVSEKYTVGALAQCVRFSAEFGVADKISEAVYFGHLSAVVCLLSLGADLYQVDNDGVSPLDAVTARTYLGVPSHSVPGILYDRHRESNTKRAYNRRRKTSIALDYSDEDSVGSEAEDEGEDADGQAHPLNNHYEVDRGDRSRIYGELYTWGSNATYTLGRPNTSKHNYNNPERISVRYEDGRLIDDDRVCNYTGERLVESQVIQVATGKFHSACIDRSGNLFTWGYASRFALGHGDDVTQLTPKQINMTPKVKIIEICVADDHMVALSSERQVYTCGTNSHHQLGHYGLEIDDVVPELRIVKSFKNTSFEDGVISIAAGPMHTVCATLESVYTFGRNLGHLGHPATINQRTSILTAPGAQIQTVLTDDFQTTPRIVSFLSRKTTVVQVSAGASLCTACLTKDGQVYVMAGYAVQCISIAPAPIPSVGGDCEGVSKYWLESPSRQRPTVVKVCVGVDNNAVALSNLHALYMVYIYPALSPKTWRYTPVICHGLGAKGMGRRIIDIAIGRATLIVTTQNGHVFKGNLPATPVYNAKRRLDVVQVEFKRILGLHRATSVSCSHRGDSYSALCETSFRPGSTDLERAFADRNKYNAHQADTSSDNKTGTTSKNIGLVGSLPASNLDIALIASDDVVDVEAMPTADESASKAIQGIVNLSVNNCINEMSERSISETPDPMRVLQDPIPPPAAIAEGSSSSIDVADVAFFCMGRSGKAHPTPVLAHRRLLAKHSEFFRTLHLWDRLSTNRMVSLIPSAPIRRDVLARAIEKFYIEEGWACPNTDNNPPETSGKDSSHDNGHDMGPQERPMAPSSQHAEQLYYLMCTADEYGLSALQRECELTICSPRYIDVRNVCDVYHGATLINARRLTDYCIAFVQLHLDILLSRSDVFYEAVIDDTDEGMLSDQWNTLVAHLRVSLTASNAQHPVVHSDDAPVWAPRRTRVRTISRNGKMDNKKSSSAHKTVAPDPAPQGTSSYSENVNNPARHNEECAEGTPSTDSAVFDSPGETHGNSAGISKGRTRWLPLDVFGSNIQKDVEIVKPTPSTSTVVEGTPATNPWVQKETQINERAPQDKGTVAPRNSLREILSTESDGQRRKSSGDGTTQAPHGNKPLVEVKKMSQRERKKALYVAALKEAEAPIISKVQSKPVWVTADVVPTDDDTFLIDKLPQAISLRDVQMEELTAAKQQALSQRRSLNKIDVPKQTRKSGWDMTAATGSGASQSQPTQHSAYVKKADYSSLKNIQQQQEDTRWKRAHTRTSLDCVIIEDQAIAELTAIYNSMGITVRVERVVDDTASFQESTNFGISSTKSQAKTTPWVKH